MKNKLKDLKICEILVKLFNICTQAYFEQHFLHISTRSLKIKTEGKQYLRILTTKIF